jgi:hypothetical protein
MGFRLKLGADSACSFYTLNDYLRRGWDNVALVTPSAVLLNGGPEVLGLDIISRNIKSNMMSFS